MTWWRHQMETFSALLAICAGNSPHKGQWRGALVLSLICVWINGWVNNREAGDLKRHRAHYGVIVMINLDVVILLNASRRPGFVCNWLKQLVHRYLCIRVRSSEVCHQTLVAYLDQPGHQHEALDGIIYILFQVIAYGILRFVWATMLQI